MSCDACNTHPTDYVSPENVDIDTHNTPDDNQWCVERSCNDCIHSSELTNVKKPYKPRHAGLMDQFDNIKL